MNNQLIEILLVEDNEDDIVLLQEAFAEASLVNVMQVARDGEEAMVYLRREGVYRNAKMPGLVLLDINMPKKNGFEVLSEMKAEPKFRHIPVVMLTTSDRDEDILKSYVSGACSFIRKPVDFDALREVVNQFSIYWALVVKLPRGGDGSAHLAY